MARPKKPRKEVKSKRLFIPIEPPLKKAIEAAAKEEGVSVGAFIRRAAIEHIRKRQNS